MTVTDVWRLSQNHKLISNAKDEDGLNLLTIKKFTGVLAKQLITIAMSCDAASDPSPSPTAESRSSSVVSPLTRDKSTASSFTFTQAEFIDTMGTYHTPSLLPMREQKQESSLSASLSVVQDKTWQTTLYRMALPHL
jgi:hypothetical protein